MRSARPVAPHGGSACLYRAQAAAGLHPHGPDSSHLGPQTSIITDGFRSLAEGEQVEFFIESGDDGRTKATQVTGPNGAPPQARPAGRPGNRAVGCVCAAVPWPCLPAWPWCEVQCVGLLLRAEHVQVLFLLLHGDTDTLTRERALAQGQERDFGVRSPALLLRCVPALAACCAVGASFRRRSGGCALTHVMRRKRGGHSVPCFAPPLTVHIQLRVLHIASVTPRPYQGGGRRDFGGGGRGGGGGYGARGGGGGGGRRGGYVDDDSYAGGGYGGDSGGQNNYY